ncbi:MAG: hypothetical protein BAJALOKI1v1_270027 [Promethearchaeota archaeon]|nr:MAG: hypothetical protein BAJALOKI1v1_270027 [Candidatus Lokiarchaeota archaeon]
MDITTLKTNAMEANKSEKGAIKYLVDCLYVYQQGNDDALGYMGYVLSKSFCNEDSSSPSGFVPNPRYTNLIKGLRETQRRNSILSTMGGTWQNDYKDVDPDNYEIKFTKEMMDGKETRFFIKAGGRDREFPINVRKNNKGEWKIMGGLSTLCMDVRKTKTETEDF